MHQLEKALLVILIIFIFLFAGCSNSDVKQNNSQQMTDDVKPSANTSGAPLETYQTEADDGPLEVTSFEELEQKISGASKNDGYGLDSLQFYYVPTELVELYNAKIDTIYIRERYVALYYYINDFDESKVKDIYERENGVLSNTIKLVWTRNEDGNLLLKNTIEQLKLLPLDDGGTYYFCDIPSMADRNTILAKSIYWAQDGYCYQLDVPVEVFEQLTGIKIPDGGEKGDGLEQSELLKTETVDGFAAIERVDIG